MDILECCHTKPQVVSSHMMYLILLYHFYSVIYKCFNGCICIWWRGIIWWISIKHSGTEDASFFYIPGLWRLFIMSFQFSCRNGVITSSGSKYATYSYLYMFLRLGKNCKCFCYSLSFYACLVFSHNVLPHQAVISRYGFVKVNFYSIIH